MKGYKGFNEKLQCTPNGEIFQYEIGGTYEETSADLCRNGFHFCENPLDIFGYYPPGSSRFCEIEAEDVSDQKDSDTKRSCKRIKIGSEITLESMCEAAVKYLLQGVDWENEKISTNTGDYSAATNTGDCSAATNTGHRSAATNTGNRSAATNTGDCSAATNTGDYSAATVTGRNSVAIVTGKDSRAKGNIGCWLVLTERDSSCKILCVKSVKVDGKKIKADTFYWLRNGEIEKYEY